MIWFESIFCSSLKYLIEIKVQTNIHSKRLKSQLTIRSLDMFDNSEWIFLLQVIRWYLVRTRDRGIIIKSFFQRRYHKRWYQVKNFWWKAWGKLWSQILWDILRPFAKEEDFRFKAVVAFVYLQLSGHTRMQCLVFVDTSKKRLTYRFGFSIHIFVKLFLSVT